MREIDDEAGMAGVTSGAGHGRRDEEGIKYRIIKKEMRGLVRNRRLVEESRN